jgi:hypothetical protein
VAEMSQPGTKDAVLSKDPVWLVEVKGLEPLGPKKGWPVSGSRSVRHQPEIGRRAMDPKDLCRSHSHCRWSHTPADGSIPRA